jgi:pyruvate dehydrogenase E1 component beta subunit
MALTGLRPVVEMRVVDFALCAIEELVNQAAKNRYMFGGQGRVPLVARLPIGIWSASAAQHSQSLEAWFAHVPGLVVVTPATPADNYALLHAALESGDPVVYMEHKELWGLQGEVPEGHRVPLGTAAVRRAGRDATLVTWSRTVHAALEAAEAAAQRGVSVEVIDLRTIWPWDRETVLASAAKTRRLLVAHEAIQAGGFGAEIAATVAETLQIPVRRLGAPRIPVGYSRPLEDEARIPADKILAQVVALCEADGRERSAARR